ncbi:MAG: hypothetical protein ABFD45_12180 [Smithella sp.]|jgi:hypothetical protein
MKRIKMMILALIALMISIPAGPAMPSLAADAKAIDSQTREMNSRLPQGLSETDREENELAGKGLMISDPALSIRTEKDRPGLSPLTKRLTSSAVRRRFFLPLTSGRASGMKKSSAIFKISATCTSISMIRRSV